MPIYDYDCAACGGRFEVIHGVHAGGPAACQLCGGGPVRKAVTAAAVHYRGSGWAKKERRSAAASKTATESTAASEGGTPDSRASAGGKTADAASKPADEVSKAADSPAAASTTTTD